MDIKKMTLEQKIGQMIVAGFPSNCFDEQAKELIVKYSIGNIVLFARNVGNKENLAMLNKDIQECAMENIGIPEFICIDQEGGMVTRIYEGATFLPGNMAISAAGSYNETFIEGQISGEELRALGINFNLAPSLDVNSNPKNPVIGVRSYGDDPKRVAQLGTNYIKGIQSRGVIACAKHFPGHGDTDMDSHISLPVVKHDLKRLENVELYPFKKAIESGVDAIMTSHILFPAIEEETIPATLSHKVLTGLLRDKMGFEGIVITDSMEMDAIGKYYGTVKATVMAVNGGADLICLSHHLEQQIKGIIAIKDAVLNGEISEKRIDESVARILKLKEKYNLFDSPYPDMDKVMNIVGCHKNREFAQSMSQKSITLVKDTNKLIPVKGDNIISISTAPVILTGADDTIAKKTVFSESVKEKIGGEAYVISIEPDEETINKIVAQSIAADVVIVGTYNANLNKNQAKLVNEISKVNKNIIVVALRNPYDLSMFKGISTYICAYEYTPISVISSVNVLAGEAIAKGRLPVALEECNV